MLLQNMLLFKCIIYNYYHHHPYYFTLCEFFPSQFFYFHIFYLFIFFLKQNSEWPQISSTRICLTFHFIFTQRSAGTANFSRWQVFFFSLINTRSRILLSLCLTIIFFIFLNFSYFLLQFTWVVISMILENIAVNFFNEIWTNVSFCLSYDHHWYCRNQNHTYN